MDKAPPLPDDARSLISALKALTPSRYPEHEAASVRRLQAYLRRFMSTPAQARPGRPRLTIQEVVMGAIERSAVPGVYFPRSAVHKTAGRSRNTTEISEEIDRLIFLGLVMEVGSQICLTPGHILKQRNNIK
jgi:hypothetical protein